MKYNPALDGIRALAVLAVVAFHARVPGSSLGQLGVDVFFVLSGYLITSILAAQHRNGGIRLGAFYLRRARRLYPALCVLVAAYCIVGLAYGLPNTLGDSGIALFYLSDYAAAFWHRPEYLLHTWSLAIEEHFYLLWPLALMGLLRLRKPFAWILGLAVIATLWRWLGPGYDFQNAYRFDMRLSGLLLGSALAVMPPFRIRWGWVFGVAVVVLYLFRFERLLGSTLTLAEIASAALVMLAVAGRLSFLNPLAYLGRISYGLYLFHFPIVSYLRAQGYSWEWMLLGTLATAVPLAMLSFHTIEAWCRSAPAKRVEVVAAVLVGAHPHLARCADGAVCDRNDGDAIHVGGESGPVGRQSEGVA
jgi:peptidoglycan/LPS O-acetylase OafA/YrhL